MSDKEKLWQHLDHSQFKLSRPSKDSTVHVNQCLHHTYFFLPISPMDRRHRRCTESDCPSFCEEHKKHTLWMAAASQWARASTVETHYLDISDECVHSGGCVLRHGLTRGSYALGYASESLHVFIRIIRYHPQSWYCTYTHNCDIIHTRQWFRGSYLLVYCGSGRLVYYASQHLYWGGERYTQ